MTMNDVLLELSIETCLGEKAREQAEMDATASRMASGARKWMR